MEGTTASLEPMAEFSYFDLDGACFRRRNNGFTESVDDVLRGGEWVPYTGSDRLKPAPFGDEIPDPLAQKTPEAQAAYRQFLDHALLLRHLALYWCASCCAVMARSSTKRWASSASRVVALAARGPLDAANDCGHEVR